MLKIVKPFHICRLPLKEEMNSNELRQKEKNAARLIQYFKAGAVSA